MKNIVAMKAGRIAMIGISLCSAIYCVYTLGRCDEAKEICDVVVDQGSMLMTFKMFGRKPVTIGMEHLSE